MRLAWNAPDVNAFHIHVQLIRRMQNLLNHDILLRVVRYMLPRSRHLWQAEYKLAAVTKCEQHIAYHASVEISKSMRVFLSVDPIWRVGNDDIAIRHAVRSAPLLNANLCTTYSKGVCEIEGA